MDRLSLLNNGIRCTGLREESSIVLFGKVVMALSSDVADGNVRMFYRKESLLEEAVPR